VGKAIRRSREKGNRPRTPETETGSVPDSEVRSPEKASPSSGASLFEKVTRFTERLTHDGVTFGDTSVSVDFRLETERAALNARLRAFWVAITVNGRVLPPSVEIPFTGKRGEDEEGLVVSVSPLPSSTLASGTVVYRRKARVLAATLSRRVAGPFAAGVGQAWGAGTHAADFTAWVSASAVF
jgi:hypothetical protein